MNYSIYNNSSEETQYLFVDEHSTVEKEIRKYAEEYFNNNPGDDSLKVCVMDFDKMISTIFECEQTRHIDITSF